MYIYTYRKSNSATLVSDRTYKNQHCQLHAIKKNSMPTDTIRKVHLNNKFDDSKELPVSMYSIIIECFYFYLIL